MAMNPSKKLYIQVICAIIAGVLLGHFYPDVSIEFKPLGDVFIRMIKMMIGPIIFVTIVVGIAKGHAESAASFGKLALKTVIYFEVVTTFAMAIGLAVGLYMQPGAGMNVDLSSVDTSSVASYKAAAVPFSTVDFILHVVPTSLIEPFVKGDMLQILFLSVLCGFALSLSGLPGQSIVTQLEKATVPLFKIVGMIMRFAPIAAFGAMAFTVGKFGLGSLKNLGLLVMCFYITSAIFIVIILGSLARYSGFKPWTLLKYFREEALIVFACASNEAVLPALVKKLEGLGCRKGVVGVVLPMSYALNLDGACIYYTMAIAFLAQALNVELSWIDLLTIFGILLLTSKGSATVTGGGFITLAATLATVHGKVPVEAMVLLLGVDRLLSEARSFTNFCGNVVATIFMARLEGAIDMTHANKVLNGNTSPPAKIDLIAERSPPVEKAQS